MLSIIVQLPSGFIDEYTFKTLEDLINFEIENPDLKFGKIHYEKILTNED